jgi:putative glycosyltransferase (TIGR04372 family)
MTQLKRDRPITKPNYLKIMLNATLGIWFIIPIILLKPLKKIYIAPIQTSRIGHFVLDTEIMLARIHTDEIDAKKKFLVIWVPDPTISNHYVYNIWKQIIHIVPYNVFSSAILVTAVYLEKLTKIKLTYRFVGWDGYLPYEHLLVDRQAVFYIPKADEQECIETLLMNGIDVSKKWVCILARDGEYLNRVMPDLKWDFNSYRNSNIDTYKDAAEYLANKNILVFRMGSHVSQPFVTHTSELVIDYANSKWRNEKLDIFLAAKCLFFISSATGLDAIAYAVRKPILTVNLAQPLQVLKFHKDHIFILKKFFHKKINRFINIKEFYEMGMAGGFTIDNPRNLRTQDFERLGIDVIDNSPTEIKDATAEMYEFLSDKDDVAKELSTAQQLFWEKYPDLPGIAKFKTALSRIGEKFIQQNPWFLD